MLKLSTFQITLLAVFGSLGLAGILIFALVTASNSAASTGPVVIWGTLDATAINQAIHDATDNDPRFSQVSYIKVDPTQFDTQLKTALASGQGPDLFIMAADHAYRDKGYAIHIPYDQFPQSQFQNTFLDTATPFLASDGIIGVPILVDPLVLYWNKDALATAGIAAPPQYWDQVPAMVESMVKKNDDGTVQKGGIALGNFDNIPAAKDIISMLILQAGGKITGLDNQNVLRSLLADQGNSTAAVTALDFYTEFADPSQADYSWSHAFQSAQASFAAGDVAMYVGHASEFNAISQTNPNLNFAMAPIPQIRTGNYTIDASDVYALSLTRTTQNAQGALTIAYLMAAPEFITPIAKSMGMASALRRAITSNAAPASNPALANLVSDAPKTPETLLDQEANISKPWIDPDPDKTSGVFRDMIENTVSGELKSGDAVQRADKQMSTILNP